MSTLTPLEKLQLDFANQVIFNMALASCAELVQRSNECAVQLDYYKELLLEGDDAKAERLEARAVTVQAMKESRKCNEEFHILAELFETRFGISA